MPLAPEGGLTLDGTHGILNGIGYELHPEFVCGCCVVMNEGEKSNQECIDRPCYTTSQRAALSKGMLTAYTIIPQHQQMMMR